MGPVEVKVVVVVGMGVSGLQQWSEGPLLVEGGKADVLPHLLHVPPSWVLWEDGGGGGRRRSCGRGGHYPATTPLSAVVLVVVVIPVIF